MDSISSRLFGWKAKCLSFVGRLTLVKHVLSTIPIHISLVLPLPSGTSLLLERLMRNFLWSSNPEKQGTNFIRREKVCLPKPEGGLGLLELGSSMKPAFWIWLGQPSLLTLSRPFDFELGTSKARPSSTLRILEMTLIFRRSSLPYLPFSWRIAGGWLEMVNPLVSGLTTGWIIFQWLPGSHPFNSLIWT